MRVSFFEGDVVDQADGADADGGGEDGRVERRDLDVVDVEAVEQLAGALAGRRVASARGRASARSRSSGESSAFRDESASPSASRTVGRTRSSSVEVEVADHPPDDLDLLRVLLAEVRAARADDVEELQADGRDAAEVARAGASPSSPREALSTSTHVSYPGG